MLHWEIDGKKRWLCRECTRMNTHIFLNSPARLLAVVEDAGQPCSCCDRRDDRAVLAADRQTRHPIWPSWPGLPAWLVEVLQWPVAGEPIRRSRGSGQREGHR